jgi:Coenzyme PQQ synthesis protein D (PqqD)
MLSPLRMVKPLQELGCHRVPSENSHLKTVVDQDGAAILDIERGQISTLNATGAYVWQGLQRGDSLKTIIANLVHETGEGVLIVERDVHQFLDELKHKHLLPQ